MYVYSVVQATVDEGIVIVILPAHPIYVFVSFVCFLSKHVVKSMHDTVFFFFFCQAAVEDSSGPEVASDRILWSNLLGSAKLLRERLSADPKSSCQLKPGCCGADPAFKQSLEVR